MHIKAKVRGFICASAHPVGCEAMVQQMINVAQQAGKFEGPKRVLVIGASTGYGLASRVELAFAAGAATIGVFYERLPKENRTASAGWYNSAAFEKLAQEQELYAKSINGDAFSDEIKQQCIDLIKQDWGGEVDLVIYSLASPRRTDPKTGEVYQSCLKSVGETYRSLSVDPIRGEFKEVSIEPATDEDIRQTVAVMGGEDWALWMEALQQAGVLAKGVKTVAYSYIGPELTYPIYRDGSIGKAKDHLLQTVERLNGELSDLGGQAWVSVNKAVVTQSSAAIPVVPLYISILFREMQARGLHEDCIEQMVRLFKDRLYAKGDIEVDQVGRIRLDDWEMQAEVQDAVLSSWQQLTAENAADQVDLDFFRQSFYHLFGFEIDGVDYEVETDPLVMVPSLGDKQEV